nr:AT-hook motif nuclear-localized protein 1-like [Tanacetum cinerariifolium]
MLQLLKVKNAERVSTVKEWIKTEDWLKIDWRSRIIDVASKINPFSKYGTYEICVLSAFGITSHVTWRQASSSGGTVTYENLMIAIGIKSIYEVTAVDPQD